MVAADQELHNGPLIEESPASKFNKNTSAVGTPLYQSPEQREGKNFNEKVDIYALGLILFEMCNKFGTEFERRSELHKLRTERKLSKAFKRQFCFESNLILQMIEVKPEKRPTAKELTESLKHWYLELKTFPT